MRTICLALTLSALALPVLAADYYVDSAAGGADTNAGTAEAPFLTLARGMQAVQSNNGDRLFITGAFRETLGIAKNGVAIIGLGDAQIEEVYTGINMGYVTGVTIENILVRNCTSGLIANGTGIVFRRLRFLENYVGTTAGYSGLVSSRFVECDWCASNTIGVRIASMVATIFEKSTFYGNAIAIQFAGVTPNTVIRNCILAGNGTGFIREAESPGLVTDYNLVFDNGGAGGPRNYVAITPGPNDRQQEDPLFLDASQYNLALEDASPALNAGRDSLGNPVTIGAHEIGVLSSGAAGADVPFSSWISMGDGKPVTDPTAQVILDTNGNLQLNDGVARAVAVSPVIDLGQGASRVTRVDFRALEDLDQPSGSKRVVDADDDTFVRTFRIRGDDATFDALGGAPAWLATTNRADLSGLRKRYVQVEFTLTRQGK